MGNLLNKLFGNNQTDKIIDLDTLESDTINLNNTETDTIDTETDKTDLDNTDLDNTDDKTDLDNTDLDKTDLDNTDLDTTDDKTDLKDSETDKSSEYDGDESYEIDESNMFDESIVTLDQKIEKAREIFTERFEHFGYNLKFDDYDDTSYEYDPEYYCCEHHPYYYAESNKNCFYNMYAVVGAVENWYKELNRRGGFENFKDFAKVFHATLPNNVYVSMFDISSMYSQICYVCDTEYEKDEHDVYPLKMCFCSECAVELFFDPDLRKKKIVKNFCTCSPSESEFECLHVLEEEFCNTCKRVKIFKYIY
uniref:Uncharacterized protein n=1 Tax=Spodoptera littoralis nuclear polyhedrosis virus TaxID=10456 RepID=A0A3G4S8Z5_NPVSL|nr:hypothetical protein [Spodoptera littoralis nucleopolyhedrovirus]